MATALLIDVTLSSSFHSLHIQHSLISYIDRDYRRSTKNEAPSDANVQSQRTSTVGISRRHRGYQPDEVNKSQPKLELGASSITQEEVNATNSVLVNNHLKAASTADNKTASIVTSRSSKILPPHRRTLVKGTKSNHRPSPQTQVATMDASRPELDLVHFDGVSEPVDSEISSTQIITERKPSCWSVVSPPEDPPTEWNSSSANIDRPATKSLPIYRFSKSEHKAERNTASHSFNQQAKRKMNGSLQLASERNGGTQATAHVTPQEGGHPADSLHHQFQELQRDERLDAEQASKIKAIQDEVLSRPMECDQSNVSTTAQDAARFTILHSDPSSVVPSLAKNKQSYVPPGKRSEVVPPHLRLQIRQRSNKKDESLPGTSASLSTIAATNMTARDKDPEHEGHATSAAQWKKLPPHLQVPSTTKNQGNKQPVSLTIPSSTPSRKDDSYQPIVDIDEEIAATQPVLDIDEEIVAGLRAETSSAILGAQPTDSSTGRTKEGTLYVSPQVGSYSKVQDNQTKSQVDHDQNRNRDVSTNTRTFASTAEPYTTSPQEAVAVPDHLKSSTTNENTLAENYVSVDSASGLAGWDGKMNQPPVDWNRRQPFDPERNERLSVVEAWREEHAADPEENNRHRVDTASVVFQNGEGLVGGDNNVLSPIDGKDHETLAAEDEFTQVRRERSAADAIKDYGAKIAAKPKVIPSGIESMTRQQKRDLRRELLENERARRALPNPNAPAANIYLRPAEFKDMGQVTTIYNYYVRETSFVLHLDNVDELYWYVFFLSVVSPLLSNTDLSVKGAVVYRRLRMKKTLLLLLSIWERGLVVTRKISFARNRRTSSASPLLPTLEEKTRCTTIPWNLSS